MLNLARGPVDIFDVEGSNYDMRGRVDVDDIEA